MDETISPAPKWRPLNRTDRRVAGVLIEKAKTTPDQYPMTLNGLVTGCNQKSNRDPQMQLEEDSVMDSLDRLKSIGAASEVQGSGRVPKFRHLLYEWLGVDKVELAVVGELLLRGAQTEGELRGRVSRMEPIADLNAMRTIFSALKAKNLVVELTPPGRGQMISHNLYEPDELERLKERLGSSGGGDESALMASRPRPDAPAPHVSAEASPMDVSRPREEMQSLRTELADLRRELETLVETVRQQERALNDLRSSLGG
ncbi:MAG: DUF480 domain-containing protein [Pirellulales bacterium]|nr:DUF480 domain-containing protein [Pirellulales bacterium]